MIAKETPAYSRLLSEILPKGLRLSGDNDRVVKGVCLDSREISPGDLFMACKGLTVDGRQFIQQAIDKGAAAVIAEKGLEKTALNHSVDDEARVPIIELEDLGQKAGYIASRYFGNPSNKLKVIGITGTNGKTTTAHLLSGVLKQVTGSCGIAGTLGIGTLTGDAVDEKNVPLNETGFTTPDAVVLQAQFHEWVKAGVEWVVIEVSSHGLDQGRLNGTEFYGAVLTNVTRDHLDYHGDFETYCNVKQALFEWPTLQMAVLNRDDSSCGQFRSSLLSEVDCYTYGFENMGFDGNGTEGKATEDMSRNGGDFSDGAGFKMSDLSLSSNGLGFNLRLPEGFQQSARKRDLFIDSPLFGEFNAYNLAATSVALIGLGFDVEVLTQLKTAQGPLGRMQAISADGVGSTAGGPTVIVDYAHTPDALENILTAVSAHGHNEIWCVFGCGGNRDKGKRSMMGEIAERLADHVIVTDDNPRLENAADIIADITQKMTRDKVQVISDRAEAIKTAISKAKDRDIVVLAGKGHEEYQDINGVKKPFSDIEQAKTALAALQPPMSGGLS